MNFNKCIWALNIELSEYLAVLLTVIYKYTTTVWYKHYNQDEGRSHDKGCGHDEGCGQDEGHDHDGGMVMKLPTVHTHYHTHTHTHTHTTLQVAPIWHSWVVLHHNFVHHTDECQMLSPASHRKDEGKEKRSEMERKEKGERRSR